MVNMGTPGSPEGLPHFTTKAMVSMLLRAAVKSKAHEGRQYATPLPHEFRKVDLSGIHNLGFQAAMQKVMDRLESKLPCFFVCYHEPPHSGCDGGLTVLDLLRGSSHMQVVEEGVYRGFRPDIALYDSGNSRPSAILEVVATSPPSDWKCQFMERDGIALFQIDATTEPLVILEDSVPMLPVEAVVNPPCGKAFRATLAEVNRYLASTPESFIGIKFFPSNAQEYLYGEQAAHGAHWTYGDPEVRGLTPVRVNWPSVPMITPGVTHTISREQFIDALMGQKAMTIIYAIEQQEKGKEAYHLAGPLNTAVRWINDLMHMVRFPATKDV